MRIGRKSPKVCKLSDCSTEKILLVEILANRAFFRPNGAHFHEIFNFSWMPKTVSFPMNHRASESVVYG